MEKLLRLHVPAYDELWYRERIMSDGNTMSYNKGYNLDCDGYNNETGCIAFPESKWRDWFNYFIGNEPERFYAYIVRAADGAFIGEVCLHSADSSLYNMGIVIESKYRGNGYSTEALKLLLEHAFETLRAEAVCNDFEKERAAALKVHLSAGFEIRGEADNILHLKITKERYFNLLKKPQ